MDISKLSKGLLGGFYDTSPRICLSLEAENNIPFGFPVMGGTNPERQVKKYAGGPGDEMIGVAAYSLLPVTGQYDNTYTQGYYPITYPVTVLRKGKIWVPIYQTGIRIDVGDIAYIDAVSDQITNVRAPGYSIAIGNFLTGGITVLGGELFALELIPGDAQSIIPGNKDLLTEDVIDNKFSKDIKKSKK